MGGAGSGAKPCGGAACFCEVDVVALLAARVGCLRVHRAHLQPVCPYQGFGFRASGESSRAQPSHRLREDRLGHPAETLRSNLADSLGTPFEVEAFQNPSCSLRAADARGRLSDKTRGYPHDCDETHEVREAEGRSRTYWLGSSLYGAVSHELRSNHDILIGTVPHTRLNAAARWCPHSRECTLPPLHSAQARSRTGRAQQGDGYGPQPAPCRVRGQSPT